MSLPSSLREWLRLPSRIALLLGVGALSAAGAKAAMTEAHPGEGLVRGPQQSAKSFGEVLIWSEGGRIYFSEGGNGARELHLADTPEARNLRHLLEQDGAVADSPRVLRHRMILVGGGGNAIHWGSARSSNSPDNGSSPTTKDPNKSASPPSGQTGKGDNTNVAGTEKQK
jgi:hypothetical protein